MVPTILYPNHYRVFVAGPSAALYALASSAVWIAIALATVVLVLMAFGLVGKACGVAH
jgi:hypothetical protein